MPPSDQPIWPRGNERDPDATRPHTLPIFIDHNDVLAQKTLPKPQQSFWNSYISVRTGIISILAFVVVAGTIGGAYYLGKQGGRTSVSKPIPIVGLTTPLATSIPTAHVVATATVLPSAATATAAVSTDTCTSGPFAGSKPTVTGSTHFSTITFPANTYSLPASSFEVDGVQFKLLSSCTSQLGTADALKQAYSNTLKNWTLTTQAQEQGSSNYVGQGCQNGCWKMIESQLLGQPVAQYLALENIVVNPNTITYTIRLTIAPLLHEVRTFSQGATIALEHTGLEDLQWTDAIHPVNNALAGQVDTDFASTTYTYITGQYLQKGLFGKLTVVPQMLNSAIVLQDNHGHYAKLIIQGITSGQVTMLVIVYAYGF